MSGSHWPWWLGGCGLAAVTVGSCLVARRPLGISGIFGRFVDLRAELAAERSRAAMASADDAALQAALEAATAEAFGALPPEAPTGWVPPDQAQRPVMRPALAAPSNGAAARGGLARGAATSCQGCGAPGSRPTLGAHALFLGGIVAGAFLTSALRGTFELSWALPEAYTRLVASGGWGLAVLVGGGVLVGLGTSLSGGCSTGHGLSGCARLQPAGLAATFTFWCTAIGVTFLLRWRAP